MAKTNYINKGVVVKTAFSGVHVGIYQGEEFTKAGLVVQLIYSRKLKNVNCIYNLVSEDYLKHRFVQGSEIAQNITIIGVTELIFISDEQLALLSNLPKF